MLLLWVCMLKDQAISSFRKLRSILGRICQLVLFKFFFGAFWNYYLVDEFFDLIWVGVLEFCEGFLAFVAESFLYLVLSPDTPKFIIGSFNPTINHLMVLLISQLILHLNSQAMKSIGRVFYLLEYIILHLCLLPQLKLPLLAVLLITVQLWFMSMICAAVVNLQPSLFELLLFFG